MVERGQEVVDHGTDSPCSGRDQLHIAATFRGVFSRTTAASRSPSQTRGRGSPAGDVERVFQEFEQSSDGKKVEGTGLGLPLSRKLVELHGGRLWVESEVGRGSTFRVTLPIGPTEPASVLPNQRQL